MSGTNQSNSSDISNNSLIELPPINSSSRLYLKSLFEPRNKKKIKSHDKILQSQLILNEFPSNYTLNKRSLSNYQKSHDDFNHDLEFNCNFFYFLFFR